MSEEEVNDFLSEVAGKEADSVYVIPDMHYGFVGVTASLESVYSVEQSIAKYYPKTPTGEAEDLLWDKFSHHVDIAINDGCPAPILINTILT
tara:strand:- start:2140 stop:2415 length:276 start_codon:yes stop_codon:yes gene_type:complete